MYAAELASIREMVRTLRPGGRLVITDMDTHTHEEFKADMADVWLGFECNQLREWFAQLILYAEAVTLAGIYVPFETIAAGALRMLADARHVPVTDQDRKELRSRMQAMAA